MNYRPRMPRNSKENQASDLIHCRAEFALFVQHELPPHPPALTEEVTTLERLMVGSRIPISGPCPAGESQADG
jgi:hypothetical protein